MLFQRVFDTFIRPFRFKSGLKKFIVACRFIPAILFNNLSYQTMTRSISAEFCEDWEVVKPVLMEKKGLIVLGDLKFAVPTDYLIPWPTPESIPSFLAIVS